MRNFKIGIRLMGAFILVALIVATVGLIAENMAVSMNANQDEIVINRLQGVRALLILNEAQTATDATEHALLAKHLDPQERKENYDRAEAAKTRMNETLKIYGALSKTKEESGVWNDFLPAWQNWMKDHEFFMALVAEYEKNHSDAVYKKMSDESFAGDQRTYFPAKKLLNKLVEINNRIVREQHDASNRTMKLALRIILVVIVLGVFLSLLIGLWITLSITKPVKKLKNALWEVGKGKFDIKINTTSKDEIGDLTNSFNTMAENLKLSIQKAKELAGAAAAAEEEKKRAEDLHALNKQLSASEERLKASNQQLQAKEIELVGKMKQTEKFNKVMVDRELDMIELKKEVNDLLEKSGREKKYQVI